MADIKKELNDIKTAIYGKDVRGSIHDGIDKINKESEDSKQKASEAHDVMESIINDGFDNAALEANFEQKLDDEIGRLQPEWTQFQTDVTSQLNDKADENEVNNKLSEKASLAYVDNGLDNIVNQINSIDKGYGGTFSTIADLVNQYPQGDEKRYVVSSDGNWYYWDGNDWVSGGVFQSTGIGDREVSRKMLTDNYAQVGQMHPSQSGTDFNALIKQGTYFRSGTDSVTDGPSWISNKNLLIDVVKYGNYSIQKVYDLDDLSYFSARRVTLSTQTEWETFDNKLLPKHSILSNGSDLSTILRFGFYLGISTQSYIDVPENIKGKSFMLEVKPHGYTSDFIIQKITETTDVVNSYSRFVRNGGSIGEWRKDYSFSPVNLPLFNKKGLAMGDSQTEDGRYVYSTESKTGANIKKAGFGGCRMAKVPSGHWREPYNEMSMVALADTIATGNFTALDATAQNLKDNEGDDNTAQVGVLKNTDFSTLDFVTLFWGTNDYTSEVPLGEPNSTNETEFNGAINLTIERLLTAYPNIQLVFVTPLWRARINSGDGLESDTSPNGIGVYLYEYVDAIIERAKSHKIPVLDAYRTSGINKYNYVTLFSDGLHMNTNGHGRFGNRLGGFLNRFIG